MNTDPVPILLVDDQPIVAAAVRRLLAHYPEFVVRYCSDPEKAEAEAATVRLALIDMVMGPVSGLDVIRQLRANPTTADLPIIILSCKEDANTKATALEAGADDYMIKLPEAVELVARLHALLRRVRR